MEQLRTTEQHHSTARLCRSPPCRGSSIPSVLHIGHFPRMRSSNSSSGDKTLCSVRKALHVTLHYALFLLEQHLQRKGNKHNAWESPFLSLLRNINQTTTVNDIPKEEFLKVVFAFENIITVKSAVAVIEDLTAECSLSLMTSFSQQPAE